MKEYLLILLYYHKHYESTIINSIITIIINSTYKYQPIITYRLTWLKTRTKSLASKIATKGKVASKAKIVTTEYPFWDPIALAQGFDMTPLATTFFNAAA